MPPGWRGPHGPHSFRAVPNRSEPSAWVGFGRPLTTRWEWVGTIEGWTLCRRCRAEKRWSTIAGKLRARIRPNGRLHDLVTKLAVVTAVAAMGAAIFAVATGATTPATPTVTAVSPDSGSPWRGNVGDDHRDQLHRGQRGRLRHHPGPRLHRGQRHRDHRPLPRVHRDSRTSPSPPREVPRRSTHRRTGSRSAPGRPRP